MFKQSKINTKLDDEILSALEELETHRDDPNKYNAAVERLSKLHKLRTEQKTGLKPPSLDTVLVVAANVFGILWIARYEREDVIKSQSALRMLMKPTPRH